MADITIPYTTETIPPTSLQDYWHHLPEVEKRLAEFKPDALVCGLGPSAQLLPHVNPALLQGIRIWGVNDFFSIMPCHDIVMMDSPAVNHSGLRQKLRDDKVNPRWQTVVDSRPERWWLYQNIAPHWDRMLPEGRAQKTFDLRLWDWNCLPPQIPAPFPDLNMRPYDHTSASPVGTVAIAWGEGARRIGIIGVDLLVMANRVPQHHMAMRKPHLSWFLSCFNHQARTLGGELLNMSPFSRLNVDKYKDKEPQRARK